MPRAERALRPISPAALFLAGAILAMPGPSAAQSGSFGPLVTEEGGPLQRIAYTPATEGADLIGRGHFGAEVWVGYSNIFEQDSASTHQLYIDMERLISTVGVRWGATERLELGGRATFETTGGGFLDGFISWWHTKLGLGNADREKYPSRAYGQRLADQGTLVLDVPRRTLALEDVRLFAKASLLGDANSARTLSLRAVTRIPTQANFVGPERTDVSLMLLGRLSGARWHLHGTAGGSTIRASRDVPTVLRSSAWFLDLGLERVVAPWMSALVQYSVATPHLKGVHDPEVDGWSGNFVFGAAGRLGPSWRWNVSFQEDIPPVSPAIDFTLGIGLRRTW
jgi:hypothetical protein